MRYGDMAAKLPPAGPLAVEAKGHWQKHHPELHHQLMQSGQLDNAARVAQQNAVDHYSLLVSRGASGESAMEDAKAKYIYLHPEEPEQTPADRHLGREQQVESFNQLMQRSTLPR